MSSYLLLLLRLISYNVKVIFANKFVYFVLAAFLFFGFIITITVIEDPDFSEAVIFGFLVFPGLLLVFYPMAYGIQNDDDSKMLETIFGIPIKETTNVRSARSFYLKSNMSNILKRKEKKRNRAVPSMTTTEAIAMTRPAPAK